MTQIEVSSIDHLFYEGTILYNFQVCFGPHLTWVVSKSYDQFVELHVLLERHYAAINLPHLTGPVRPWARSSSLTAAVRQPKLETYINEALVAAPFWFPRLYDVAVANPEGGEEPILVNKFLCAFLEVLEHTVSNNTPREDEQQKETPVKSPEVDIVVVPSTLVPPVSTTLTNTTTAIDIVNLQPNASALSFLPVERKTPYATPLQEVSEPLVSPVLSPQPLPSVDATTLGARVHSLTSKSPYNDSDELALDATVFTITSQMLINVKDFSIIQRDHIEYFLHVSLCGHHWVVTKRYKQFHELHVNLVEVYGDHVVPMLPHGWVSAWRKLNVETGEARKKVFNRYLQEVVMNIDSWEPRGLLASFDLMRRTVHGDQTRLTVYVNQILFDFLDFSSHIDALSGEVAAKVVVEHRAALPESVKLAYDKRSIQKKRLQMRDCISNNTQRLSPIRDDQLQALLDRISLLQDDRDIMRMFRRLLLTGEVDVGVQSSFADLLCDDLKEGGEGKKGATTMTVDAKNAVVGLTALQLASITERLFFNDSKRESIRLFAGVLVDADNLQEVFDTLWFGWEEAQEEVEQILSNH